MEIPHTTDKTWHSQINKLEKKKVASVLWWKARSKQTLEMVCWAGPCRMELARASQAVILWDYLGNGLGSVDSEKTVSIMVLSISLCFTLLSWSQILSARARSCAWFLLSMMHWEKGPGHAWGWEAMRGGPWRLPWCKHPQRVVMPRQVGRHRGCGTTAEAEGEE